MRSNTARSRKHFEDRGWWVFNGEKFNHYTKRREDIFGFGDLLVMHPQRREIAIVQTTSRGEMFRRRKKIKRLNASKAWKQSGGGIILHGWKQFGTRWELKSEVL